MYSVIFEVFVYTFETPDKFFYDKIQNIYLIRKIFRKWICTRTCPLLFLSDFQNCSMFIFITSWLGCRKKSTFISSKVQTKGDNIFVQFF
jgi:hypothetical protein